MSSAEMNELKQNKNTTLNSWENSAPLSTGCVIMASGLGKRFGGNKLMADLGGKPMIKWILDTTQGLFAHRVVVTRSEEVKELCEKYQIDVILHNEPGRNDTVRLGLSKLASEVDYCFFTPADQPFISRETFYRMIIALKDGKQQIWRTAFGERVGAPVVFPKWTFDELLLLPEGKGGSEIIKRYSDKVKTVQVNNEMELEDIDTQENLTMAKEYLINAKIN